MRSIKGQGFRVGVGAPELREDLRERVDGFQVVGVQIDGAAEAGRGVGEPALALGEEPFELGDGAAAGGEPARLGQGAGGLVELARPQVQQAQVRPAGGLLRGQPGHGFELAAGAAVFAGLQRDGPDVNADTMSRYAGEPGPGGLPPAPGRAAKPPRPRRPRRPEPARAGDAAAAVARKGAVRTWMSANLDAAAGAGAGRGDGGRPRTGTASRPSRDAGGYVRYTLP
jgi:hypothetical protein